MDNIRKPKSAIIIVLVIGLACGFFIFNRFDTRINSPARKSKNNRFSYPANYYVNKYDAYVLTGDIDEQFVQKVKAIQKNNSNLLIMSGGGISQRAIEAAKIIQSQQHNLIVLGQCSSACAEFLLPAAGSIVFIEKPFIGFHGNTIANMDFIKTEKGINSEYCSSVHALEAKIFYLKTLGRYDFWKKQYKHLIVKKIDFEEISTASGYECKKPIITTQHDLWYPTSEQLRHEYGISFKGQVCADDYECYSHWLTEYYPDGSSFAVGDTEYVVNK